MIRTSTPEHRPPAPVHSKDDVWDPQQCKWVRVTSVPNQPPPAPIKGMVQRCYRLNARPVWIAVPTEERWTTAEEVMKEIMSDRIDHAERRELDSPARYLVRAGGIQLEALLHKGVRTTIKSPTGLFPEFTLDGFRASERILQARDAVAVAVAAAAA